MKLYFSIFELINVETVLCPLLVSVEQVGFQSDIFSFVCDLTLYHRSYNTDIFVIDHSYSKPSQNLRDITVQTDTSHVAAQTAVTTGESRE